MNPTFTKRRGFTLVELLAVISIIGIIAALVLTGVTAATSARRRTMVETQKQTLMSAIQTYKDKLNFYPPDNGSLASITPGNYASQYDGASAANPLLYELVGATAVDPLGTKYNVHLTNGTFPSGMTNVTMTAFNNLYARGAIANSDPTTPQNFLNPQPQDFTNYSMTGFTGFYGLTVAVPLTNGQVNFWHYDSSSQYRHNPSSFDLWAEFSIVQKGNKPVVITNGNW
jgi:prepilin-type N-terminal cleavage/methylation domain-containing protein